MTTKQLFLDDGDLMTITVEPAITLERFPTLAVWYDPSDCQSVRTNNVLVDPQVLRLKNKAAAGGDAALVPVGAGAPLFVADGINGRGSLGFDGGDRALALDDAAFDAHRLGTDDWTMIIVARHTAAFPSVDRVTYLANCGSDPDGGGVTLQLRPLQDEIRLGAADADDGSRTIVSTDVESLAAPVDQTISLTAKREDEMLTLIAPGYAASAAIPGSLRTLSNPGTTSVSAGRLIIGAQPGAAGAVQHYLRHCLLGEVLVFKSALSVEDLDHIDAYLHAKWGA